MRCVAALASDPPRTERHWMTLRHAGRLHHLRVGTAHARTRVLAIVGEQAVTAVALDTGEILSAAGLPAERAVEWLAAARRLA